MWRSKRFAWLLTAIWISAPLFAAEPAADEGARFYAEQVQPILQAHCYTCHGNPARIKGGLRLTSRESVLTGGDSGPAVSIEKPEESLLLEAINYQSLEMPPKGKLPQAQIDILTRWVKLGLPGLPEKDAGPVKHGGAPLVNEESRRFWSFQPVWRPEVPAVRNNDWVRTPIDAFILCKLEAADLAPAPPASRTALLRRAYYDLIGLPPSPDEVRAYLADASPQAFEKVVDRLLNSPHYGERWGRHWLDLVRYAETNSYERDGEKPFVWRYRDYVIRSFNADKPYDQFIREQLAGDELDEVTADTVVATGYYRLGIWDDEPVDAEQAFYDDMDDVLRTTGETFLGLTVGCARCHDHKIDPISQKDYYGLLSFLRNVRRYGVRAHETVLDASVRVIASEEELRRHAQAQERELKQISARMDEIARSVWDDLMGVEKDEFQNEQMQISILKKRVPKPLSQELFDEFVRLSGRRDQLRRKDPGGLPQALCVKEHGPQPPPTHVLLRGSAAAKGEEVAPAFPSVLSPPEPVIRPRPEANSSGRRRALAEWIASAGNPLTARVMANRVWQYHFGRGIVRTPSDFGFQGAPPTHPELLDWLASEFIAGGWKLKPLHRLIMLSSAYQMSSQPNDAAIRRDPLNDLFWRFDMRRLEAEEIRDSILAVNGALNRGKMHGPSIYTIIPQEVLAGQSQPGAGWGKSSEEDRNRRSIYIHVKRSLITPVLASFDAADTDNACPVRFATTQPTQALGMLNSEFINREAEVFAVDLRRVAGDDSAAQVREALWRVTQREPMPAEVDRGVKLIDELRREHGASTGQALALFCVVALNLNEFLYVD